MTNAVSIDPKMPWHPKIAALPVVARWALFCSVCYSHDYLTDGLVPISIAESWEGQAAAAALVEAGYWLPTETHYVVHDYLDWNPSKAEVLADRAGARERAAKSRRTRTARAENITPSRGGKGGRGSDSSLAESETPSPQGVGGSGGKGVRARDVLWDALVAWYGSQPAGDERGAWNRALKVFREAQPAVTADEIPTLFDEARRQWAKPFKPTGVAANLTALRASIRSPSAPLRSVRHSDRAAEIMQEALNEQNRGQGDMRPAIRRLPEGSDAAIHG